MLAALDTCTNNCSHFLHCESRQGRYYCKCQAGFTGPHCDINIDECISNPCINGECLDDVNRYDCECNEGYWGNDCEKKINNEEGRRPIARERCRKVLGRSKIQQNIDVFLLLCLSIILTMMMIMIFFGDNDDDDEVDDDDDDDDVSSTNSLKGSFDFLVCSNNGLK